MSTSTRGNAGERLKRVYDLYAKETQNLKHQIVDTLGKSSKKYSVDGEGFFGAINDYGNEAVGAINEDERFRTVDTEHYAQWKVTPKVLSAPIEFTGLFAEAAKDDDASFAAAVMKDLERAKDRLLADKNRQFFGMGTGLLCSPTATVASNLTSFTVDSTQYLRRNMVVDMFSGATKTVDSIRISRVDSANNVVHLATSLGAQVDATVEIVKENIRDSAASDGKEMMGLRGIVDDGTDLTTFQNIDASANDEWQSIRIDADSANLTSDLLQRLEDDVRIASGEEGDTYIGHVKQRRKYLDIVVPEKRYMDGKMDAGFTRLTFNGKEFLLDKDCQSNTIYLIKKSEIKRFSLKDLSLVGHEDSGNYLRIAGYDKYEAAWIEYGNLGTGSRKCHGKIVNLAKPSGRE